MSIDDIIDQLESLKDNSQSFIEEDEPESIWVQDIKALEEAISFIGYRREKKVKKEKTLVGRFRCPTCNAAFIEGMGKTNYCGNCGQKLDWGE